MSCVGAKSKGCMKTVGLQKQLNISTKNGKIWWWQWGLHKYQGDNDDSEDYISIVEIKGVKIVLFD